MKIILLQWLPASWKTTWANEFIKENKSFYRISKDDLRETFAHLKKENQKEFEQIIIIKERALVLEYMQKGLNIILDNTHLLFKRNSRNPHIDHYKAEAKKYGYEFEIKTFYIDLLDALIRDSKREKKVGIEVYERFMKTYIIPTEMPQNPPPFKNDDSLPTAVIVDIDGTLAFMDWKRSPYDYSKVGGDRVNNKLLSLLSSLDATIFIVSGRKSECRKETEEWLKDNWVLYHKLFMRLDDDTRDDATVKEEIYKQNIEGKYNVLWVFDDRDRVVKMWRKQELPCYQVYYGNF